MPQQPVVVDASRIQGFGSDSGPPGAAESGTQSKRAKDDGRSGGSAVWDALESVKDSVSTPAVQSAIDNVSLRVGDAWESASQDVSEMALNVKSWVSSFGGGGDDTETQSGDDPVKDGTGADVERTAAPEASAPMVAEAKEHVSRFCTNIRPTRLDPSAEELETLWAQCSILQVSAVAVALSDQLSYGNGDYTWQPRYRILFVLENFVAREGLGKEIVEIVTGTSLSILQHLATEVPQCNEKANHLLRVLRGEVAPTLVAEVPRKVEKRQSAPRQEPQVDLLDFSAPASSSSAKPANAQGSGETLDLLMDLSAPVAAATPAPAASSARAADTAQFDPSAGQFDPNAPSPAAGMPAKAAAPFPGMFPPVASSKASSPFMGGNYAAFGNPPSPVPAATFGSAGTGAQSAWPAQQGAQGAAALWPSMGPASNGMKPPMHNMGYSSSYPSPMQQSSMGMRPPASGGMQQAAAKPAGMHLPASGGMQQASGSQSYGGSSKQGQGIWAVNPKTLPESERPKDPFEGLGSLTNLKQKT